jgi:two-component system, LytTR family, response regulator AlgR
VSRHDLESGGPAAAELRVFLADDEAPARARLKEILEDIRGKLLTTVVGEAANGLEAIERLPRSGAQLLLLDIQMPGMDGIELARHLGKLENAPAIVFVTAHDRHAIEAFEVNALDYLMKPVRADRLVVALKKALAAGPASRERLENAASGAREYFSVAERNRILLVPVADVLYLKAELKYVTLRTRAGEHLIEEPLISIEREFAERFVRVHRNCLVARGAIRGFERIAGGAEEEPHWNVVLDGLNERLPVSRRQWPAVKNVLPEAKR